MGDYYKLKSIVGDILIDSKSWNDARYIWQMDFASPEGIKLETIKRFVETLKQKQLIDENYELGEIG